MKKYNMREALNMVMIDNSREMENETSTLKYIEGLDRINLISKDTGRYTNPTSIKYSDFRWTEVKKPITFREYLETIPTRHIDRTYEIKAKHSMLNKGVYREDHVYLGLSDFLICASDNLSHSEMAIMLLEVEIYIEEE